MLDLSRKLTDELVLGDDVYPMNIAFNKVLKVMELINDDEFDDIYKPYLAIQMFTGVDVTEALTPEQATAIFKLIFEEHIRIIPTKSMQIHMRCIFTLRKICIYNISTSFSNIKITTKLLTNKFNFNHIKKALKCIYKQHQ